MGAKARITMANVTPGTRTHRGCKISELAALTTTTHEQHEKIRAPVSLAAHGLDLSGERDTSCALLVRRDRVSREFSASFASFFRGSIG